MSEQSSPPNPTMSHTGRYRLNLFLFVVLMILLAVWFQRHLAIYVTEILLVSGTLSLWAFWQIAQSWLQWGWDEESDEMRKRLLSAPRATEYIVFAFIVLGILWLTTSSVYVTYEGAAKDQASFKIQVLHQGKPYLPPLEITSYNRVAGRPFFLHWHSVDLSFELLEPRGYDPLDKCLSPWTGVDLRVPADFTAKKFRVLRVVPLRGFNQLPPVNKAPDAQYAMQISRGGPCGAAGTNIEKFPVIDDIRRQAVYIGASEADIRWLIGKRDDRAFQRDFIDALARNGVPAPNRAEWVREWEAEPRFVSGPAFRDGDQICIQILQSGQSGPQMQANIPKLTFESDITSEYMEGGQ